MMQNIIEVLVTLPFDDALLERLREISASLRITKIPAHRADEIPEEIWRKVEVLYTNRVLPDPERVPMLRWIQLHWAGIDHAVNAPIVGSEQVVITSLSGAAFSGSRIYCDDAFSIGSQSA